MKTILLVALLSFFILSCKKHREAINIKIKDKPLSTIKADIQGQWQLHYAYGGITGNTRVDYENMFIVFKRENRILWTYNSQILADTIIYWKKVDDFFTNENDSTYIITFSDTRDYPYDWIVDRIYNDTLVLVDYADDPMGYYLTREK